MTRETRVGLVLALVFIMAFGLVLSELTGNSSPAARKVKVALRQTRQTRFCPIIQKVPPQMSVACDVAPAARLPIVLPEAPVILSAVVSDNPELPTGQVIEKLRLEAESEVIYKVQPNDSLWNIAKRFYGEGSEHRLDEIFRANRGKLKDESRVFVGQELIIPSARGFEGLASVGDAQPANGLPIVAPRGEAITHHKVMDMDQLRGYFGRSGASAKTMASGRIYVVRDGDNLTRIAERTLNDDSRQAVMRIYDANRDRLSNPDFVTVGAELRIPL